MANQEKIITKVQTQVSPSTQQHLDKGLQLKRGVLSGKPTQIRKNDRVLIYASNDYGNTQEWVTIHQVNPNPPRLNSMATQTAWGDENFSFQPTGSYVKPTADLSVREVKWSATGLPTGLTINPVTGQITGRAAIWTSTTVPETKTISSKITVTTNNGTATTSISFYCRKTHPLPVVGVQASTYTASSEVIIKSYLPVTNWDYLFTSQSKPSVISNTGSQTGSTYKDYYFIIYKDSATLRTANFFGDNPSGIIQYYIPLPTEALRAAFGRAVLLRDQNRFQSANRYRADLYFAYSRVKQIRVFISDRLKPYIYSFNYSWGPKITVTSSYIGNGRYLYLTSSETYYPLQYTFKLNGKSALGYSSTNKSSLGLRQVYPNDLWLEVTVTSSYYGSGGILYLPLELGLGLYGPHSTTVVDTMPAYNWGNGAYSPNTSDGQVLG